MNLAAWKKKIFELFRKFTDSLRNLWAKMLRLAKEGGIKDIVSRIRGSGVTKQRALQFGLGGFIVLVLILLVTALAVNFKKPNINTVTASAAALSIPSEELFIPAEPDFLPEFLLQREPRSYWSLEDIEPYWKAPSDQDLWREEIKSTVDKLMDGVP